MTNRSLLRSRLFLIPILLLVGYTSMSAMTDLYQLSQFSGSKYDMTGSTEIFYGGYSYAGTPASGINIGFTFYFDNAPYTTFGVNPGGLMSLNSGSWYDPYPFYYSYCWPNYPYFTSYFGTYPLIAPFWLYMGGPKSGTGKVHYKLVGSAPNRVLVVEWLDVYTYNGTSTSYPGGTWQVRLYEGSNTIEYWYGGSMNSGSTYYASIGIASSASRYINVYGNNISQYYLYPNGQYYFYRYTTDYPMTANQIFQFSPCDKRLDTIIGDRSQGGSAQMQSGDVLFSDIKTMRGNTGSFQPFTFKVPKNPCSPFTYTISFTGAAAGDYSVSPANGTVITNGMKPTINFTPGGVGVRQATMTMKLSSGEVYTYLMQGEGTTRIAYTGNVAQGGTVTMRDGDNLLTNINIPRNTVMDLTPFTITNINAAPTATNTSLHTASLSVRLDDPNDQYQIGVNRGGVITWSTEGAVETINGSLAPGEQVGLVVKAKPSASGAGRGTGNQQAPLKITADNEVRNFILNGYSVAPAIEMVYDGKTLSSTDRRLFRGVAGCVGLQGVGGTFEVQNTNKVPVTINGIQALEIDDVVRQGNNPYRYLLDAFGDTKKMPDYFLSTTPVTAPVQANDLVQFPMTLQPGESRTLYLGFVAQRPEKRYTRLFIMTDAVNTVGKGIPSYMPGADFAGSPEQEGIVVLEMYARGIGGHLAKDANGTLNGLSMTFSSPNVDESTTSEVMIYNTGECDLLIDKDDLKLMTGDISDFSLISVLPNTPVDGAGHYVIPSGGSDRIVASFRPLRSGSRRAQLMLRTNDSTVVIEGATDRGIYYLNFYGVGHSYLEAKPVTLPPAVIDGDPSMGSIMLENASTDLVSIASVAFEGPDAAEFSQNMTKPWPVFPMAILPGQKLELSAIFVPASGSITGNHMATVAITTTSGDVIRTSITALAGTRMIMAAPATLFSGVTATVGTMIRRTAVITNTGSFPVRLSSISITGAGKDHYRIATSNSMDLDPGQSKFLEVTFEPKSTGPADAQIEIQSNATAGLATINLMGVSNGTAQGGGVEGASSEFRSNGIGAKQEGTTGAISFNLTSSLVRDILGLNYTLSQEGRVEIGLYNVNGQLVRAIVSEWGAEGRHQAQVAVGELPSGIYQVRMVQGEEVRSEIVRIVR